MCYIKTHRAASLFAAAVIASLAMAAHKPVVLHRSVVEFDLGVYDEERFTYAEWLGHYEVSHTDPGPPPPLGDLDGSGVVDGADFGLLLAEFGTNDAAADLNDDGIVDGADVGLLLANWS
jgi:hypothetical protein